MNEQVNGSTLTIDDTQYFTRITKKYANRKFYSAPEPKKLMAFIPGTIRNIFIKEGQIVKKGDSLLELEAMKMINLLKASIDGKVIKIYVETNQSVMKNQLLLEFE